MELAVCAKVMSGRIGYRGLSMNHRGVEYSLAVTTVPGIWKWQFRIGDTVKSGKTETRINLLAVRRVQLRIDRELKKAAQAPTP
jgi:hypothetical protein